MIFAYLEKIIYELFLSKLDFHAEATLKVWKQSLYKDLCFTEKIKWLTKILQPVGAKAYAWMSLDDHIIF